MDAPPSAPPPDVSELPPLPGSYMPYPPWGVLAALVVLAVFGLTQVGVSLLAALAAHSSGAGLRTIAWVTVPATLVVSHGAGWLAIYWLLTRRHHMGLLEGLRLHGPPGPVAGAFFAGMGLQVAGVVLVQFVPPPPDFVSPVLRFARLGPWALALLFVMAVVMAPLLEEALFRGVLQPALRKRHSFIVSALAVTALFTALHATQTGSYWPPLVAIALCGWFLARWRERSGSLWPPIALHAGFNFTAFLPVLLLKWMGGDVLEGLALG